MKAEKLGLILLAGLAFGTSVVMTRFGIREIPPLFLVVLRLGLATLLFIPTLLLLRKKLPKNLRAWLDIIIVGVTTTGIPLTVFTIALKFISSGVLTVFIALIPLFTAVMAHFWLTQERLTVAKLAGLGVGFAGVILLIITRTTGLYGSPITFELQGQILALLGVMVAAASAVYTRRRLRDVDVFVVTAGQMLVGFLIVLPFAATLNSLNFSVITWRGWLAAGYTGLVGSFLAFLLIFTLIKRFGATTAALPSYVMPAVSAVFGAVLLGEIITTPLIVGAVVILLGVYLASR